MQSTMFKNSINDPQPEMQVISLWKGVNKYVTPSEIAENELADAQNIQLYDNGLIDKRYGYEKVYNTSLGNSKINGIYNALWYSYIVFAWGTGLYKQSGSNAPVSIYNSLTNTSGYFFTMSGYLFYINGTEFVKIDNSFNVVTVESIAYIPTTIIGRSPSGGGTVYEAVNLLQPGRKNSFIGDGSATDYHLDTTGLDATFVTATVGGAAKVETTDFTVNRTTGIVTFNVAPANGSGVDNVVITFYKTVSGYANKIKNCTIQPVLFGGDNDTRVFLANGNTRYHSGLFDATYWPDLNYTKIGSDQANITKLTQQIDTQVILKEHKGFEPSIWTSRYDLTVTTNSSGVIVTSTVTFPVQPINGIAGCDAKNCCEIVQNNPVFLDTQDGLYQLVTSNVRDQRVVSRMSDRINKDLLNEPNLSNATSFLNGYKFGICVNNNAYVWDYRLDAFYGKWTNINASCFAMIGTDLYFGGSSVGMLYRMKTSTSLLPYDDDGVAIQCYVLTKYFSFGKNWLKKLLSRIFIDLKCIPRCSTTVSYTTDKDSTAKYLPIARRDLFDYSLIDYSKYSYGTSLGFPKAIMRKIREKGFVWIQFKYENNNLDEGMPFVSTQYQYIDQGFVKNQ